MDTFENDENSVNADHRLVGFLCPSIPEQATVPGSPDHQVTEATEMLLIRDMHDQPQVGSRGVRRDQVRRCATMGLSGDD